MAARSKTAITTELRTLVKRYGVGISGTDNPGDVAPVPQDSMTPNLLFIVFMLVIIEVLLNIRNGES